MLLALKFVDYVHIFSEDNPIKFLQHVLPYKHVNGSEYGKDCIESKAVKNGGGSIHVVSLVDNFSTSDIIKKIKKG